MDADGRLMLVTTRLQSCRASVLSQHARQDTHGAPLTPGAGRALCWQRRTAQCAHGLAVGRAAVAAIEAGFGGFELGRTQASP